MAKVENANGTTKKVRFFMNTSLEGGEVVGPDYDTDIAIVPAWQANAWINQGRCEEYVAPVEPTEPTEAANGKTKTK